jgi:hypothetical protein
LGFPFALKLAGWQGEKERELGNG